MTKPAPSEPSMLNRLPPHSVEAEQGVIGAMLMNPAERIPQAVELLGNFKAFWDVRHQELFRVMQEMQDAGESVDPVTLPQKLKDLGLLGDVGGYAYLNTLMDFAPSAANLPMWASIVDEKRQLRKMLQVCTEASIRLYDESADPEEVLAWIEQAVMEVRHRPNRSDRKTIRDHVLEAIADLETEKLRGTAMSGLATGLVDLDRATLGLHPGEMTVLAAYPSTGKTALAMNLVEHAVLELRIPVGVFSLEMSGRSLVRRMLASRARVCARSGSDLADSDFPKLLSASAALINSKLFIDDSSDLSVFELRARARRMVQQHNVKMFVVDYLQLLNAAGGTRKVENRQQEVSDISRNLKGLANEFGVPVLALSQLNDDGKLRDSRAIGQDADCVWFLSKKEDTETPHFCEIIVTIKKQRNGPAPVSVSLMFRKDWTRFENAAHVSQEDYPSPSQMQGNLPYTG